MKRIVARHYHFFLFLKFFSLLLLSCVNRNLLRIRFGVCCSIPCQREKLNKKSANKTCFKHHSPFVRSDSHSMMCVKPFIFRQSIEKGIMMTMMMNQTEAIFLQKRSVFKCALLKFTVTK